MRRLQYIVLLGLLSLIACQQAVVEEPIRKEATTTPNQNVNTIIKDLQDPQGKVLVVAHRGDWRNAPENSLLAIQGCIDKGVDMIEIDVRKTKDGHLILMHDETLDRTTNGTGRVDDWTLDSIRTLRLRNGLDRVTQFPIPTLEEAMNLAKGKIMINLDKCYAYFPEAYKILEKTGTVNHVIMKGKIPVAQVKAEFGEYLDKVFFMPIVDLANPKANQIIKDYQEQLQPVAYEFLFGNDSLLTPPQMLTLQEAGARPWVNSIYPHLCANHDDDVAVTNLANSYDWILDHGFNMIQTDRPELLIDYLQEKGLR